MVSQSGVNLDHKGLLVYLSLKKDVSNVGFGVVTHEPHDPILSFCVILEASVLMHWLLAFAYCDMVYVHSKLSVLYTCEAVALDRRAKSHFRTKYTASRVD